jgi:hypothetical protein
MLSRRRSFFVPAAVLAAVLFSQTLTAQTPRVDARISGAELTALLDRFGVAREDVLGKVRSVTFRARKA